MGAKPRYKITSRDLKRDLVGYAVTISPPIILPPMRIYPVIKPPKILQNGITHAAKKLSGGMRPDLRSVCGKFDNGEPNVRYSDAVVEPITHENRAKIDCPLCIHQLGDW